MADMALGWISSAKSILEEPIQKVDGNMRAAKERTTSYIGRYSARLHIGEAFISEIDLRK
ncbi:hypothetical protein NKH19_22385 [Mesorhizobium sp. M1338]|uniref:hypothetical protein n=1 Tax=unclassified Mesorhizobium TaxID=325217 RepID=UPI0033382131